MHDDNLNEIIKDFKRGNSRAFNQIYSQTHKLVYKCAFSMLKNDSDANDVMQNVYIKVYNKLGCLKDESKFQSWLMSITYNEAKNLLSSQKRYSEVFNCDTDITEDDHISFDTNNECGFENDYMTRETNNIIKGLIDGLPHEQKEVLMMYYFEEKDISSIANILKCPKGTVQSRLNYSRKNLKKSINTYEEKNQIRLHSGLATLINIECMKKFLKYDTAFKVAAAGVASVCAVTYGVTVLEINKNPDKDTENIYKYEEVSDTEETTELTEELVTTAFEDDIAADITADITTIHDYNTEKHISSHNNENDAEATDLPEELTTDSYNSELEADITVTENPHDTNYNNTHFHEETDEINSYFYNDNKQHQPMPQESDYIHDKPGNMPPYYDYPKETEEFKPPYYDYDYDYDKEMEKLQPPYFNENLNPYFPEEYDEFEPDEEEYDEFEQDEEDDEYEDDENE